MKKTFCTACGNDVPHDAEVCPHCGDQLGESGKWQSFSLFYKFLVVLWSIAFVVVFTIIYMLIRTALW
jgi:predicted nucleic acid-binding Zn ribbon protein